MRISCNRCGMKFEFTGHQRLCKDCLTGIYGKLKPQAYEVYDLLCYSDLTVRKSARLIGCYSLAPRIHELRAVGLNITTTRVNNRNNVGTHAVYSLQNREEK